LQLLLQVAATVEGEYTHCYFLSCYSVRRRCMAPTLFT